MPPQNIGPYGIIKELGRGNMGVVYLGYDAQIGRPVAIKTIYTPADDPEAEGLREALARDARAAGRLLHPNIVTIFHMGRDGDTMYVVMEYVAGSTVAGWWKAQPRRSDEVIALLSKVAEALDYAHGLGIVHRDIKPTNVLVAENGQPKVTDFGLAKLAGGSASASTRMVGTPRYMSPEQIRGPKVDGRSDQFSLGIMAYELLTGRLPFPGDNLQTLMYQILMQEPPPAHIANAALPAGVSEALAQALAKDPARRHPSCGQFLRALDAALRQPLRETAGMRSERQEPIPPRPRPRIGLWVAGAFAAMILLFGAPPLISYILRPGPHVIENPHGGGDSPTPISEPPPPPHGGNAGKTNPREKSVEVKGRENTAPAEPKGDPEMRKALYEAIKSDRPLAVIEDLIGRGASPEGEPGSVPLTRAASKCRPDIVKLLLANHADVKAHGWDDNDEWPLKAAARAGCVAAASTLLEHGEDPNRRPQFSGETTLAAASGGKSAAMVRLLLDRGADINAVGLWLSPLAAAARECDVEIARLLIDRGANVNGAGDRGVTPLMAAADLVCEPTAALLLAKGAHVNQRDQEGKTALYHAIDDDFTYRGGYNSQKMLPVAQILLDAGASPNVSPGGEHPGVTPLMLALTRPEIASLFRTLLEKGADPKAVDGQGRSALMYAVQKSNFEAFQELMSRGAPVNVRDKKGLTVLDYAKEVYDESLRKKILAKLSAAGAVE